MRLTGTSEEIERELRIVADVDRTDGPPLVLDSMQPVSTSKTLLHKNPNLLGV